MLDSKYRWIVIVGVSLIVNRVVTRLMSPMPYPREKSRATLRNPHQPPQELENHVKNLVIPLIEQHQRVMAIKIARETLGITLLEAKHFVDQLASEISP